MTVILRCEQLTQVYRVGPHEVIALQGLELTVDEGEVVGIVGASGSGKSTLLKAMAGLLRPTGGSVQFDRLDLGTASRSRLDRYRREAVGFVWQSASQNLVPYLSAAENVTVAGQLAAVDAPRERARELLASVGLEGRMDHRPTQLSGGEQQRVGLAIAMVNRPRLLLADEPTGALDAAGSAAVFELMQRLREAYGLTVVLVSHDREIGSAVDRVLTIRDGRVSAESRWTGEGDVARGESTQVIDSFGRVQLTDEQRAALGHVDRIVAQTRDDVVEIRPASKDRR